MKVIERSTGKRIEAAIENLDLGDLNLLKKGKEFSFNWESLKIYEIFKLKLADADKIVGLMAVENRPEILRISTSH